MVVNMNNIKLKQIIIDVLKSDDRLWNEDKTELNQTLLLDLVENIDEKLIELLLQEKELRDKFFVKIKDVYVFKTNDFRFFIEENKVDNSYTQYKNRIGLTDGKKFLKDTNDVVLNWPYKDCVLEGGQSTEEGLDTYFEYSEKTKSYEEKQAKRKEIFFNSVLAHDEIDRLFDHKALTNWKRFTKDGEQKVKEIKRDDDGTIKENLIIKGNNLLALHSLKKQFAGKVKLIYIDPPYNTGNDGFKYNDNFNHSTWLTFMKNRLEVARELLKEDGLIFISIDDNEIHYLKVLMDEIFDRENYLNTFCWVSNLKGRQISGKGATKTYEYILVYAKNKDSKNIGPFEILIEKAKSFMPSSYKGFNYEVKNDQSGSFILKNELYNTNSAFNEETRPNLVFNIHYNFKTKEVKFSDIDQDVNFEGFIKIPPKENNDGIHRFHAWRWNKNKILRDVSNLEFVKTINGVKIFTKIREYDATNLKDIITDITTTKGTYDIKALLDGKKYFNYPKPVELIKIFVSQIGSKDIVLDFFSGSGTTAHAVLELNKEDGGNRKFIMIEQMDYINTVTCPRVQKVMEKENIDDSFIYFELAKWNETAKEKIRECESLEELEKFFDEMYERYFLNYNLKIKEFKEKVLKEENFRNLSLDEQKKIFVAMLDNNQMYVNKTEMADKKFGISEKDQNLTNQFYNS
jgi:adenine-specific DNA-methyltransferase